MQFQHQNYSKLSLMVSTMINNLTQSSLKKKIGESFAHHSIWWNEHLFKIFYRLNLVCRIWIKICNLYKSFKLNGAYQCYVWQLKNSTLSLLLWIYLICMIGKILIAFLCMCLPFQCSICHDTPNVICPIYIQYLILSSNDLCCFQIKIIAHYNCNS